MGPETTPEDLMSLTIVAFVNSAVGITTYLFANMLSKRPAFCIAMAISAVLVAAGIECSLGYLGAPR